MSEAELQAIDDMLAKLLGGGKWWVDKIAPYHSLTWEVRCNYKDGKHDIVAAGLDKLKAAYIAQSPKIIRQLLDEVRFLRGQLTDLCEDSRAAAEVGRLREVLLSIREYADGFKELVGKRTLIALLEKANVEGDG